jgi:ABC-type spermidine/putrescine transport system permease subunit II
MSLRLAILLLFATPLLAQTAHSVKLTWNDTVNPSGTTYNVYRASAACSTNPTLTKITASPISAMTYTDASVVNGTTYCFAVTAVGPGGESAFSNEAPAVILAPPNAVTITVTVN